MSSTLASTITLADLAQQWLPLSAPYRPSAFWFWNADMNTDRMREMMDEMAARDIREFLIHPVHGLEIEYLSAEFFDRYRYALQLAKERGLKAWVYDEFGWPSGNVGGLLLREHPEHHGWYLRFDRDEQGNVTAWPEQSDRIMDNVMGSPWTRSEPGYLDTLSPEAVGCFIDMTHGRIAQECGDLFREVIVGFFTDEPVAMMDSWTGSAGGWQAVGLPWTPSFPARFKERFGYDIEPHYTELVGDGPNPMKRDYWSLVKEMHADAYHGQIGRWCREHGVKYTGHLGEDVPLEQVRFAGSVFQCLRHMDEPGIDYLGWGSYPEQRFVEEVLIPSVARHAGRPRVYCEAFGISPFGIHLGTMLRQAEMMGIHGIDDIALMGFQQALDGVRKYTYWPPIFMEAPWWPFYDVFRDGCARTIGLSNLGTRQARYAILYPQNQLEQTDLLNPNVWEWDPASRMLNSLGLAVYAAGETFDFVFPEILDEATVAEGKIRFPHAEYDAILAPGDTPFFPESMAALDRLAGQGGTVQRAPLTELIETLPTITPSWADDIALTHDGTAGDIRIYQSAYPDGKLITLRNVTDDSHTVTLRALAGQLAEWDAATGAVTQLAGGDSWTFLPHTARYFTLTVAPLGATSSPAPSTETPVEAAWTVETEHPNTARLAQMQFRHEGEWLDAISDPRWGGPSARQANGIPVKLFGQSAIEFRASFTCEEVPDTLGIIFERAHLSALCVNGTPVDLAAAVSNPRWDMSCRLVDIRALVTTGENIVTGTLAFQPFETSVYNHAFYKDTPMPSADVFLAGAFRGREGVITRDAGSAAMLPVNLTDTGWAEYFGVLRLAATVQVDTGLAATVCGLTVDPVGEDGIEVLLDGRSLGMRITHPYSFPISALTAGEHEVVIRMSGTSANLIGSSDTTEWGVAAVRWQCR